LSAPGFVKGLLATSLVLLGFVSTNALFARFLSGRSELRLPLGSTERVKLAEYREHAGEYDAVFVGTSRILRGVDPTVFDRSMGELGHPLRSYNFGLNGMGFLEQLHLVDWILAQRPDRLRFLFIEPTERDAVMRLVGREEHKVNLFTMRSVYWHAPEETWLGIHATWDSPRKTAKKIELTRLHLLHLVHRLCNVGVGVGLVNIFLTPGEPGAGLVAGFVPRDPEGPEWDAVAEGAQREAAAHEPGRLVVDFMTKMAERTRAAGVRPLFVLPPTPQAPVLSRYLDASDWQAPAEVLHYSRKSFPEILADQNQYFYDEGHLNLRGAELFSARLARDFAALLGKQ
jgi:hypothetical protein